MLQSFHRQRHWLAFLVLFVGFLRTLFQTTPTTYSVPGYTKPDPEKATTKDLATAVDAVAQSASHGIYSVNFVWTLVAGFLVMFMQAGFALVETGPCPSQNPPP